MLSINSRKNAHSSESTKNTVFFVLRELINDKGERKIILLNSSRTDPQHKTNLLNRSMVKSKAG